MPTTNDVVPRPTFEVIFFDLDDTLYPPSNGLMRACVDHIREYLVQNLGLKLPQATKFSADLYATYGSTLAGLVAKGYKCDYIEYNRFVHGNLPYEVLQPDPTLRNLLLSMPQRRIVFTNGDKDHAHSALTNMGIKDCFEEVICFETLNSLTNNFTNSKPIVCKPSMEAFKHAIEIAKVDADKILFLDDNVHNIKTAKAANMWTCVVGTKEKVEGADYAIEKIKDVKQAIPEIWDTRKTLSIYAIIRMICTFIIAKFRSIFGSPRRLSF